MFFHVAPTRKDSVQLPLSWFRWLRSLNILRWMGYCDTICYDLQKNLWLVMALEQRMELTNDSPWFTPFWAASCFGVCFVVVSKKWFRWAILHLCQDWYVSCLKWSLNSSWKIISLVWTSRRHWKFWWGVQTKIMWVLMCFCFFLIFVFNIILNKQLSYLDLLNHVSYCPCHWEKKNRLFFPGRALVDP